MKIDRVHFYVKDAIQIKDWFVNKIGFQPIYSDNQGHTHTEAIAYNSVKFLISAPLNESSPVADYLQIHPPGVADVAFRVKDLNSIVAKAQSWGKGIFQYFAGIDRATIKGWGALKHTLIEAEETTPEISGNDNGIVDIDHLVLNVPMGQLAEAVDFYRDLFGFEVQQTFNIQTSQSGLFSQALIDRSGKIQFNINEPTSANSQIQEFLKFNNGAGIQHLALRSTDLINTVEGMRDRNIAFLSVPKTYYRQKTIPPNLSESEWLAIQNQQILVESDRRTAQSLLMQIFTQPIFGQPTFFLEFIERRHNAKGFGKGNFTALFEAVEREQQLRD